MFAIISGGAPCALLADDTNSMAAPMIPTVGNPNSYWGTQVTADYFHYSASYTPDVSLDRGSTFQTGDLYGGTVSVKAPFMQPDEYFDFSYHYGNLTGSYPTYDPNNGDLKGTAGDSTRLEEIQLLYRLGVVNRRAEDPKFKLDLLLGVEYQVWNSDETLTPPNYWVESGNQNLVYHQDTILAEGGLGAHWYWWTRWNQEHSSRFRIGLRGEAQLGLGAVHFHDGYGSDDITDFAMSGTGKGVLYTDYKFGDFTAVLEGGWQYTEYGYFSDVKTSTQSLYGPYVRVGIGYSF